MVTSKAAVDAIQAVKRQEFLSASPSQLLRLALKDLAEVEKMPDYRIDMTFWMRNIISMGDKEVCYVCLAGACLVRRYSADRSRVDKIINSREPEDQQIYMRMCALDCFRQGQVAEGLRYLGFQLKPEMSYLYPVMPYFQDVELAKEDMADLAELLEAHGF
jgi:hypothetical protein